MKKLSSAQCLDSNHRTPQRNNQINRECGAGFIQQVNDVFKKKKKKHKVGTLL